MRKVYLLGTYLQNSGPSNVNRSLIEVADKRLDYIRSTNKVIKKIERFIKDIKYRDIIISGQINSAEYYIFKILKKRIFYLMHGCMRFENEINKLNASSKTLILEDNILALSSKIIAVSENYALWLKERFPNYANKIVFANNGIEINVRKKREKEPYSIALAGGNRMIKNNLDVCKAVEILREKGFDISIKAYGRMYSDNDNLMQFPFVTQMGHLAKDDFYSSLDNVALVVINSEVESFGLVVADALNCNCALLMSKNVGALGIMRTGSDDIINNPHNHKEIAEKILNLLNESNSSRLLSSINRDTCSSNAQYVSILEIIKKNP